jgi:quinol monooxygenase YgiN
MLRGFSMEMEEDKPLLHTTIRMMLPHQKCAEALKILRSIVEQDRVQPGCLRSRIYGDLEKENVIMIEEMWQDQENLERHLCSEEYRNLLLVVEMALECPEITFNSIANTTGIETIEKARSQGR